jgi:hypothetical protein
VGFIPVVNQGGKRVVRWYQLVIMCVVILSAVIFGSCLMSYFLTGDWRDGAFAGICVGAFSYGMFFYTVVIARGFKMPVEKLPTNHPKPPSNNPARSYSACD